MRPLLSSIGISWESFAGSVRNDRMIHSVVQTGGILLVASGILSIAGLHRRIRRFYGAFIPGILILTLIALLETKEHFFRLIHFFEFGIQLAAPIALMLSVRNGTGQRLKRFLEVSVALTFAAHGLYALNVWPIPGNFIDMTIVLLGCSQDTAEQFLIVAGVLDLLIALVLIAYPKRLIYKASLVYACAWGLATALARVAFHYTLSGDLTSALHGGLYLTIYRLPHGLIPLLLLISVDRFKSSLNG